MSIREVMSELKRWTSEGRACGVAILYQAQHSSPRPVGSCLAVADDGRMAGAISMGCVESDIREHLLELLNTGQPPQLLHYGAANDMLLEVGLTCGGEIDVMLSRFDLHDPAWQLLNENAASQPCLLFTIIDGAQAGAHWCLCADGTEAGGLNDGEFLNLARAESKILFAKCRSHCLTNARGERLFAQHFSPPAPLAIVGGNPIAVALCDLASRTGFEVTVIDPRVSVAPAEYYPRAKDVVHEWPRKALQDLGVDARWCVAVLSHDQKLDVPAIETALELKALYVGLLGSQGTQLKRRRELLDHGVSEEQLNTVYGPIGFKGIGAVTSPEIAVSILAEIIACRHQAPLAVRKPSGSCP